MFRGPSARGSVCLAEAVRVCVILLGSGGGGRGGSGERVCPPPPPDSREGLRGTGHDRRRASLAAGVPSPCAAARGAAQGLRGGTHSRRAKGKKFAPSPNFGLQRRPARAPARRGPHPRPRTRPAARQAPQRRTPKVAPSGLGLRISLPAATVESRARRAGAEGTITRPPPPPPHLCKWPQGCGRLGSPLHARAGPQPPP